jgi:hypothetical protein
LPDLEVRFETPPGDQAQVDFAQFQLQFTDEPTITRALVALCIAQPVRFGMQQGVQGLFHATPYHPIEVGLDPIIMVAFRFNQIRGRQPYSIVRNVPYVIMAQL